MTPLRDRVWRNIGFIATGAVLAYSLVGAFDPPRLNWGDPWSDYDAMVAGRNFQRYGFLHLRLTPHLLDMSAVTKPSEDFVYTHYPQLPDLVNGILRTALRMSDLTQFRLVALLFSFGSLFFAYAVMGRFWSRQIAQIALALWVTNPLWLQYADYLHQAPLGAFFGFGSVYFLVRSFEETRPRAYLLTSGVFLLLAYLSSYDYWIFAPLILAAMTMRHYRAWRSAPVVRTLGSLAAFAVAAILFKLATNLWALGGLEPFWRDLRLQMVEHATSETINTGYARGLWPTLYGRVDRFFSILLLPLAMFWVVFPLVRKRAVMGERLVNPLILLIAALPFLVVFRELWIAQYSPALMLIPFYAVGFAALAVWLLENGRRATSALAFALLAAVMWNALDTQLRFKKAFFEPGAIQSLRARLDTLAPRGQWLLANHDFEAWYRYYFDRPVVSVMEHPTAVPGVLAHLSDPSQIRVANARGALLIQHKHIKDELFDKGYYWILAQNQLWNAWGEPSQYRRQIDAIIASRDAAITREATRVGEKLYETDFYVLWRIPPHSLFPAKVER